MSSMIPMPPRQIQIGGGGGAPSGPGLPPSGGAPGQGGPDSAQVKKLLQNAITSLDQAKMLEGDDADAAQIAKISAEIHSLIGAAQKMEDTAFGAGPGVKLVRKNGAGAAPIGG